MIATTEVEAEMMKDGDLVLTAFLPTHVPNWVIMHATTYYIQTTVCLSFLPPHYSPTVRTGTGMPFYQTDLHY
jgi:hypothetical protein